jgi:hypothetical protein
LTISPVNASIIVIEEPLIEAIEVTRKAVQTGLVLCDGVPEGNALVSRHRELTPGQRSTLGHGVNGVEGKGCGNDSLV